MSVENDQNVGCRRSVLQLVVLRLVAYDYGEMRSISNDKIWLTIDNIRANNQCCGFVLTVRGW